MPITKPTTQAPPAATTFRSLLRLSGWGFCAAFALGVLTIVGQTDKASERIQLAFASLYEPAKVSVAAPIKSFDAEAETRRLAYQMQLLATDRDRLATRLASIERTLDDVTGSVKAAAARTAETVRPEPDRPQIAAKDPAPSAKAAEESRRADDGTAAPPRPQPLIPIAAPPPLVSAPEISPVPPAEPQTAAPDRAVTAPPSTPDRAENPAPNRLAVLSQPQAPRQQPQAVPQGSPKDAAVHPPPMGKLEFGIDLGGASTIDGLRGLWTSTKTTHAPLLDNLEPSAILRPTGKGGAPQLRLMAGPFPDGAAAAALCRSFATGRGVCRPFAFDGPKLPLR